MSKENFKSFYITGIRAFQSAAKQAIEGTDAAIAKFIDPELREIAIEVKAMLVEQVDQLSGFLQDDDAPLDAFHDQIMDGIGRGTALMLEAANDGRMKDIALVSSGTTAMEYFVNAYKKYAHNSEILGYPDRVGIFNKMAQENQRKIEAYARVLQVRIIPRIVQD